MINQTLDTVAKLQEALIVAEVVVSAFPKDTPYQDFQQRSFIYFFISMNTLLSL
jgi:sucrose synthase